MNWLRFLAVVLTSLFTMAKLAGMVAWSWWLVMLPAIIVFGGPAVMVVFLLLIGAIINLALVIKGFNHAAWEGFKEGWNENANSKHDD